MLVPLVLGTEHVGGFIRVVSNLSVTVATVVVSFCFDVGHVREKNLAGVVGDVFGSGIGRTAACSSTVGSLFLSASTRSAVSF